jgi:DNA polymerase III delta subunit
MALGGTEHALLSEALALLKSEVLANGDETLNYHRFGAEDNRPDLWLSCAQTAPFLARERFIEVHNAEKINTIKEITEYLGNPSDFAVLVFIFSKLDKRNKLVSLFEQQKILFEFSPPNSGEIESIVLTYIKNHNIKISSDAVSFLIMTLDHDLSSLREAIKKLSLVYQDSELSLEQVAQHITGNALPDVFKLARAMSEGDIKTSLYTLGVLRHHQENAVKFLGVLIWQFRIFVHIRHCLDRGMADWDIRKEVSVYGDRFTWMLKIAKKRNASFHSNRLTRLLQCDLALKSQKIAEPLTLIEKVVYQSAVGIN